MALDVQNDVMSGASPWFIGTNIDGNPGVITSGASISDQRVEVGVTTRYFWADGNAGFNVAQSKEDDYEATSWAFDASWNSDDNARTWTTSLSSSNDTVEPEQGNIPVSVERDSLDTQSLYFGMSQILSSTALMRVGLSYTVSEGYLSDPINCSTSVPIVTSATPLAQVTVDISSKLKGHCTSTIVTMTTAGAPTHIPLKLPGTKRYANTVSSPTFAITAKSRRISLRQEHNLTNATTRMTSGSHPTGRSL